jgi:membrane protein implicated in regulation of membrane protease activity
VIISLGLFTALKIHFFTSSSEIPIEHPVIGQLAIVIDDFSASLNQWKGKVRLRGEIWKAVANTPLKKDSEVQVSNIEGLCLTVQPKPTSEN